MTEPCLCGAPDCLYCFPNNFRNGRYIGDDDDETTEESDDGGYEPDRDDFDDPRADYIAGNGVNDY